MDDHPRTASHVNATTSGWNLYKTGLSPNHLVE